MSDVPKEYGLQPRSAVREDAPPPASLLDRVKEIIAEDPPSQEPPTPEPVEDAPLGYITVRTTRWRMAPGMPGWVIKDGYDVDKRPRTKEDGDKSFVVVDTSPAKRKPEAIPFPGWGESGRVDPKIAERTRLSSRWAWAGDNRNAAYHEWQESQ